LTAQRYTAGRGVLAGVTWRACTTTASSCETDTTCLANLRELRREELWLVADVRAHTFTDITESNYWHRGRLKFPSEIEQLLRQVDGD